MATNLSSNLYNIGLSFPHTRLGFINHQAVIQRRQKVYSLDSFVNKIHTKSRENLSLDERIAGLVICENLDIWISKQIRKRGLYMQLKNNFFALKTLCDIANRNFRLFDKNSLIRDGWKPDAIEFFLIDIGDDIGGRALFADNHAFNLILKRAKREVCSAP